MSDNRTSREVQTRDLTEHPKQWMQPELLPVPVKQPGYEYRWIRVSIHEKADPRNVTSKMREGWEPVKVEEQPDMQLLVDPNSRFKDSIEIGGLLLCKTPTEFVRQRNEFFAKQARAQTDSVDNNFMRQSDPRMPTMFKESKATKVTVGTRE